MKNPKTVLVMAVVMTLLLIHVSYQTLNHASGDTILKHTIYSPYNTILGNIEDEYIKGGGQTEDHGITSISVRFENLDYPDSLGSASESYCKIGGWYTVNVYNDPGEHALYHQIGTTIFNRNFSLFYCKTTLDLARKIKIPNSWNAEEDHLTLYCNDGQRIMSGNNFEIWTGNLKAYKLCILKNQDKSANNTIIYGFEVGNSVIDSDTSYFYELSDQDELDESHIMKSFNTDSAGSNYHLESFPNKIFDFTYDLNDSFFILKDSNESLDSSLILPNISNSLTRVLLLNRRNGKTAYGYETAHSMYDGEGTDIRPVYIINLSEFSDDMTERRCGDMLASYGDDNIICDEPKSIIINSKEFEEPKIPFNLFKNIILSAEDDGEVNQAVPQSGEGGTNSETKLINCNITLINDLLNSDLDFLKNGRLRVTTYSFITPPLNEGEKEQLINHFGDNITFDSDNNLKCLGGYSTEVEQSNGGQQGETPPLQICDNLFYDSDLPNTCDVTCPPNLECGTTMTVLGTCSTTYEDCSEICTGTYCSSGDCQNRVCSTTDPDPPPEPPPPPELEPEPDP